jgi:hypothetical protein
MKAKVCMNFSQFVKVMELNFCAEFLIKKFTQYGGAWRLPVL